MKHLSLFRRLAKSCSYLDWTRSSFLLLLAFQAGAQQHSRPSGMQRAPFDLQVLPIPRRWVERKPGPSSHLHGLRGQSRQDECPDLAGMAAVRVLSRARREACCQRHGSASDQCGMMVQAWGGFPSPRPVQRRARKHPRGQERFTALV